MQTGNPHPDRILVLGIGNILWADEGFGVRAVEALHRTYQAPAHVTVMDGGTQGLYLVQHVQEADRLIVFDAVDYGVAPGTLLFVRDADVPKFTGVRKMSLHQTGFQEVLSAAELLGHAPRHMLLIGCQPLDLEGWGAPLSAPVAGRIGAAVAAARDTLAAWGVTLTPRDAAADAALLGNDLDHQGYERRVTVPAGVLAAG